MAIILSLLAILVIYYVINPDPDYLYVNKSGDLIKIFDYDNSTVDVIFVKVDSKKVQKMSRIYFKLNYIRWMKLS